MTDWLELEITKPFSLNGANYNHEGGRGKTSKYKAWIAKSGWEVNIQPSRPIKGLYELQIITGRKVSKADVDNIVKSISDLLVKIHITGDDSKMIRCSSDYVTGYDKTLIRIRETEIESFEQWRKAQH